MGRPTYRRRRLEEPMPARTEAAWLTSYCDMVSLLLCLFIVMYGMSKVNEGSFRQLAEALSKTLATGGGVESDGVKEFSISNIPNDKNAIKVNLNIGDNGDADITAKTRDLSLIKSQLDNMLGKKGLSKSIDVRVEERGLVIGMMTDKVIFKIGEAELAPQSKAILMTIAPIIKGCENQIRIEGNTCNLPIFTSRFKSNWELSTMRATNVARALIQSHGINPDRVSIMGFGETRPLFKNDTEKNRAKNRRVDIVILNKKYSNGNAPPPEIQGQKTVDSEKTQDGGFWDGFLKR